MGNNSTKEQHNQPRNEVSIPNSNGSAKSNGSKYQMAEMDSKESLRQFQLGETYVQQQELEKAEKAYIQSLRFDSTNQTTLSRLISVYRSRSMKFETFYTKLRLEYLIAGCESHWIEEEEAVAIAGQSSSTHGLHSQFNSSSHVIYQTAPHITEIDFEENSLQSKATPSKSAYSSNGGIHQSKNIINSDSEPNQSINTMDLGKKYFISNKAFLEILPLEKSQFRSLIRKLNTMKSKQFELMFVIEKYFSKFSEYSNEDVESILQIYATFGLDAKAKAIQDKMRDNSGAESLSAIEQASQTN